MDLAQSPAAAKAGGARNHGGDPRNNRADSARGFLPGQAARAGRGDHAVRRWVCAALSTGGGVLPDQPGPYRSPVTDGKRRLPRTVRAFLRARQPDRDAARDRRERLDQLIRVRPVRSSRERRPASASTVTPLSFSAPRNRWSATISSPASITSTNS